MASFLTSFHFSVTLNKDSFNFLPVLHDHHIILPSAHFLITVKPKSAVKSSNDSEKLVTYLEEKYVSKKLRKTVKLVAKQLTQLYFFCHLWNIFLKIQSFSKHLETRTCSYVLLFLRALAENLLNDCSWQTFN